MNRQLTAVFLLAVFLFAPCVSFAASVPNFFGIAIGLAVPRYEGDDGPKGLEASIKGLAAEIKATFGQKPCYLREGQDPKTGQWYEGWLKGSPVYPADLNKWSPFSVRQACRAPSTNKSNFGYIWIYVSNKKIPSETDVRICVQPRDKGVISKNKKPLCTPWASQKTGWQNMPWAYQDDNSKKYPDGYRLMAETRKLPGQSITDVRLRATLKTDYTPETRFITTKWTSQGGGWSSVKIKGTNTWYPMWTGGGNYSEFAHAIRIDMDAKKKNVTKPDLVAAVTGIAPGGSTVQGSAVSFLGTVTNGGDGSTGGPFNSRFEYRWSTSGAWIPLAESRQSALAVGPPVTVTSSPPLQLTQSGLLQVRLCTDTGNSGKGEIPESIETNNCDNSPAQVTVSGRPNLHISSLTASPSGTVTEGTTVNLSGVVHNNGNSSAAPSTAQFCINGINCTNHPVGALGNGANGPVNRPGWKPAPGTYTVRLCADIGDVVPESNPNDNCSGTGGSASSITVTVNRRPVALNPRINYFRIRNTTTQSGWTSGWTSSNPYNIIAGEQIALQWDSTNTTRCDGVPNGDFSTGGRPNGEQSSITEPGVGQSTTYSVQCNDNDGTTPAATAQIRVKANEVLPDLIPPSNATVREGTQFRLTWDLKGNNPALCTLSGPGSTTYAAKGSMTTQTGQTPQITAPLGTATYTLDCEAGEDQVDIQVLPQVYES